MLLSLASAVDVNSKRGCIVHTSAFESRRQVISNVIVVTTLICKAHRGKQITEGLLVAVYRHYSHNKDD